LGLDGDRFSYPQKQAPNEKQNGRRESRNGRLHDEIGSEVREAAEKTLRGIRLGTDLEAPFTACGSDEEPA